MRATRPILATACLLGLTAGAASAQDSGQPPTSQQMEERRQIEARDRFLQNIQRLGGSRPVPPKSAKQIDDDFIGGALAFRGTVTEFGHAISANASLDKHLKELDRFIDHFRDYLKARDIVHAPAGKAEFADFSRKDLLWETLASAERVDADLRLAAELIRASGKSDTVSIKALNFLYQLDGQILRLELLTALLKEPSPTGGIR